MIGYARVSTDDQKLDMQIQALKRAGCHKIFTDRGQSGGRFDRQGLNTALQKLQPGGTLVVWRLDRLGRSLSGLVALMDQLGKRGIHFRSLTENIDTASSGGRLMFHMMAALAEFERSLISERTRAGMEAARAKGKHLGRPRALSDEQIGSAWYAIRQQNVTIHDVANQLQVSPQTLRRHFRELA